MDEQKTVTHLLLTLSVTFAGEGQEALVASRVIADGKEVVLPFAVLLGAGGEPLTVLRGMEPLGTRKSYAGALHKLGMGLYQNVIDELERVGQPAVPIGSVAAPSLDSGEN